MKLRANRRLFVPLLVLALTSGLTLFAQAPAPQQAFAPAEKVPFDTAVTRGTLPNGLT